MYDPLLTEFATGEYERAPYYYPRPRPYYFPRPYPYYPRPYPYPYYLRPYFPYCPWY
ncbi:hypothetical protein P4T89_05780 [Bacillus nakamurai]|nr:hypothetical protein [Bacillus nakamurai]MCC9024171.1 hypothetical protein [Bacillus nakamurai]MED1227122.1 hypothetical protein [Bacillus nakamurai]